MEQLQVIENLQPGWCGEDSLPPTKSTIKLVKDILSFLDGNTPTIEPCDFGEINLSWGVLRILAFIDPFLEQVRVSWYYDEVVSQRTFPFSDLNGIVELLKFRIKKASDERKKMTSN